MESRHPAGKLLRSWKQGNKVLYQLLILFGLTSCVVAPIWSDCPTRCTCKWISGKKTATCISAGFTGVPMLDPEIQVLDLKNNHIPVLYRDAFSSIGLVNLQKIYLKNTTLYEMHRDSFNDLKILIELDLSENQLNYIPRGTFSENERLRILSLSGNPLKVLPNEQFPPLPHLRTLELENCKLHTIETEAFIHLSSLENLNLNSNDLAAVKVEAFFPMFKLKTLSLDGNPWRCDCELRDFRNWYLAGNLHSVSLACKEPERLTNMLWENVVEIDFACHPRIFVTEDDVINKDLGENVTLHCYVSGDPEPTVTWFFNREEIHASNETNNGEKFSIEIERVGSRGKWYNLTAHDINDSGEFVCEAHSYLGTVSANVSLILTQVFSTTHVARNNNYWFLFTGLVVAGLIIFVLITSAVACGCMTYNRKRRRKHRRKTKSKSFYDQEKHLLDVSSSNTDQLSRKSSCERLGSQSSMELLKHSSSASIDRYNSSRFISKKQIKETSAMMPLAATFPSALGVYPPPPEFSSPGIPQSSTLGNIFISVQLSPDGDVTVERYPDLLDTHRRRAGKSSMKRTVGGSDAIPFATLPRRQLRVDEIRTPTRSPKYDNMGKRVTVGGSSTLSLHQERDNIPTPPPPPLSSKPDFDYIPL